MSKSSRTPEPSAVISAWISVFCSTLSMRAFSTLRILPRSGSTAWVARSRPCLAEPPAESPSTMNSSVSEGSRIGAVGELARQRGVLERGLAAREVARLAGGGAGLGGRDGLVEHALGLARVLLEELGQRAVDDVLDEAGHARVAELGLRLALELRVLQLHGDDGGQALADVVARQRVVLLAQVALLPRVAVERAGQRGAEARQVRAALVRVDVVGEAVDRLLVGGVPLHRDLDRALVAVGLEEDDLLLDRVLVLVEVADEVLDAALVVELGLGALGALVGQRDAEAAGEEGGLAQALLERRELEVERLEHFGVRQEGDDRARLVRRLALLQRALGRAAHVVLASRRGRRGGSRCAASPTAR